MGRYDYKKAVQSINYLISKLGKPIKYMKILKLIYFADRYHLRKYGRTVSGAVYYGMKYGPVASEVKDVLNITAQEDDVENAYKNKFIKYMKKYLIGSLKEPDFDEFSESDIEALDFSLKYFSKFDQYELANITHLYPEWENKKNFLSEQNRRFNIDIMDFFENPDEFSKKIIVEKIGKDPFEEIPENIVKMRKELLSQLVNGD